MYRQFLKKVLETLFFIYVEFAEKSTSTSAAAAIHYKLTKASQWFLEFGFEFQHYDI